MDLIIQIPAIISQLNFITSINITVHANLYAPAPTLVIRAQENVIKIVHLIK